MARYFAPLTNLTYHLLYMGDLASDQDEPTDEERERQAEYEARRKADKMSAPTEEGY